MGTYSSHRNTYTEFRGFLVVAVPEVWYDAMAFTPMGHFMVEFLKKIDKSKKQLN